jgi:hypothetical protein
MAEQRRRMSQRIDRAIDELPGPPLLGEDRGAGAGAPPAPWGAPPPAARDWGAPPAQPPGGYPGYGWGPGYGPAPYGYGGPRYGR